MKKYPNNATYNKLIRDNVADNVRAKTGLEVVTKIVDKEEAIKLLKGKIKEEVQEIEEAENENEIKDELADIIEVVYGLIDEYGFDRDEIEEIRLKSLERKGGYKKREYLIETREAK